MAKSQLPKPAAAVSVTNGIGFMVCFSFWEIETATASGAWAVSGVSADASSEVAGSSEGVDSFVV